MRGAGQQGHRWPQAGLAATAAVLALVLAGCSGGSSPSEAPPSASSATAQSSSTTTTAAASVEPPQAVQAVFAACESDYRLVQTALAAYQALNGADPVPPAAWTAATYQQNWSPLTAPAKGGPLLSSPPSLVHFVIEYDAAGHVWIEPPGQFDSSYDPAREASDDVCIVVSR